MSRTIPFRKIAPVLLRDPLEAVDRIGVMSGGDVVRLNFGGMRPWLVTRPADLEHMLIDNKQNYVRGGWLWQPLSRLLGNTSDERWWTKREVFARIASGKSIRAFADQMAITVTTAVDEMAARGAAGEPLDAATEMARLIHRIITKVLLGDRITNEQADYFGENLMAASNAMHPRLMFPLVPNSVPFPGDGRLRRAVRNIDGLVFPLVREAQRTGPQGLDIVSRLLEVQMPDGKPLTQQELRDGMVAMFVGGTETTGPAMTLLWTVLLHNPEIREALQEEVDRVVGDGPLTGAHLSELTYARNTALEMLRLFPPGWMLPRKIVEDDVIGGVRVRGGNLIVMSPYLTNRLPEVWDRPLEFDPSRHERGAAERPTFSYLTFGGGVHACVGKPFFLAEVQMIIAAIMSRYRLEIQGTPSARPSLGLTLHQRDRSSFVVSRR
ncbi:cytochrome P450 [Actinomadura roseirufa]|uniref:cytochrome P450 n=1 Tax=Actinomadura roseirufa TaxID=2094049 RepID=UPI001041B63A|nr:cytochrome P450 [Actinomadura roseirufa]